VTATGGLTGWEGFAGAAAKYGAPGASLWGCPVRQVEPDAWPVAEAEALVSTRARGGGFGARLADRPRWHIEDDACRELKGGRGWQERRWGRDAAAAHGRMTLTCPAFNTAPAYRSRAGQRLAKKGIRRLRREYQRPVGAAPAVVSGAGCYAVPAVEEPVAALGRPARESPLPFGEPTGAPENPEVPP
jgi:hypothetical protein